MEMKFIGIQLSLWSPFLDCSMKSLRHVLDGEFVVSFYFSTVFLHSKGHPIMWGWHTSGHPSRLLIPTTSRASDSSVSTPTVWKARRWESMQPLQRVRHSGMEVQGTSMKWTVVSKTKCLNTNPVRTYSLENASDLMQFPSLWPQNTKQNTKNVPFSSQTAGMEKHWFWYCWNTIASLFLNGWIRVKDIMMNSSSQTSK